MKSHIWSVLKIFIFFDFKQKLAISEKITKDENFQNRPNMTYYGLNDLIWHDFHKN
jgi:hypothetical protein